MTYVALTPAAQQDLAEIWEYSEAHWGRDQAVHYLQEVRDALQRVSEHPERARPCDDVRAGYRKFPVGSHHIYFVERSTRIEVIRILHQRMDPRRHV